MVMRYFLLTVCFTCVSAFAQVDDISLCFSNLEKSRNELSQQLGGATGARKVAVLKKMLDLGMWDKAYATISADRSLTADDRNVLLAYYHILNNDYAAAEKLLATTLKAKPTDAEANKLNIRLLIEAWKLDEAVSKADELSKRYPDDLEISLLKGRALLLQRDYDAATALVADLHKRFPNRGGVYRLEADIYFWNLQPAKAEPLLVKSLEIEPFDADARFSYGYAIWRRVDATQLDRMADQWELALALNPLHFSTHWHWGNGHTNRTFVDYADPDEEAIRARLAAADSLFTLNKIEDAIQLTRTVEKSYPKSVLPQMHRAALWYGDFDNPQRPARLDSAQALFRKILTVKQHYGPAHNGLSAVIKSKRIPYLCTYDSITAVLRNTKINDLAAFEKVFPDVSYYPGELAKAMAYNQLNTAVAYFPFLIKQDRAFVIPPLHQDLAIVMKSPYFRYATTFDNRQWMDIRGVGSGAAAIEYVERGAYQERNVILHEYVHLFHEVVLTDYQNRRIRELYYHAMANDLTLDYYSQNNEHEYLAQTYPAYFEPMKVHPLDFKSMNTTSALIAKDPDMYAFLDDLISNERRYLAGDKKAMASNWAEVYINLSNKESKNPTLAALLLDTALVYDDKYQPAWLAYATLKLTQNDPNGALACIKSSEAIDPAYAPTYRTYADWVKKTEPDPELSLMKQVEWMRKALSLEKDWQTKAGMAQYLRQLYADHAKVAEAIAEAEAYIRDGSEISTYLRDRKDDARMFAASRKAMQGDRSQLAVIDSLVKQKPQNYNFSLTCADALAANGEYRQATELMQRVQSIFAANRNRRPDFDLRIAENLAAAGQTDSARTFYNYAKQAEARLTPLDAQRLYRLSLKLNTGDAIPPSNAKYPEQTIAQVASSLFTQALLEEKAGDKVAATNHCHEALKLDPYLTEAKQALIRLIQR